ncbi:DUF1304 family protein [Streptomyces sp. NPDC002463]|uniref:DUF1304 family protein n=1 Tax=Streptomyces sp. NPDC002463 TaxID=3364645 RepID=UPI0036A5EF0C
MSILAAGLVWGAVASDPVGFQVKAFFLACVSVAGVYGAMTSSCQDSVRADRPGARRSGAGAGGPLRAGQLSTRGLSRADSVSSCTAGSSWTRPGGTGALFTTSGKSRTRPRSGHHRESAGRRSPSPEA